jgi:hypothetical protein
LPLKEPFVRRWVNARGRDNEFALPVSDRGERGLGRLVKGLRCGRVAQAMTQAPSVRVSPSMSRRRRLSPATR